LTGDSWGEFARSGDRVKPLPGNIVANSCPFGALLPFSVSGVTGDSCDLAPIDDSSLLGLDRNAEEIKCSALMCSSRTHAQIAHFLGTHTDIPIKVQAR
jgi:hypothetical protein